MNSRRRSCALRRSFMYDLYASSLSNSDFETRGSTGAGAVRCLTWATSDGSFTMQRQARKGVRECGVGAEPSGLRTYNLSSGFGGGYYTCMSSRQRLSLPRQKRRPKSTRHVAGTKQSGTPSSTLSVYYDSISSRCCCVSCLSVAQA